MEHALIQMDPSHVLVKQGILEMEHTVLILMNVLSTVTTLTIAMQMLPARIQMGPSLAPVTQGMLEMERTALTSMNALIT